MKLATLCSGMGAPEEAARRVGGITPIWCAEIEPQPAAVLQARHPGVANLGDITAADFVERALAIGRPDVLVAGTPCQSFSVAGLRRGLADERGNLTLRFVEIVDGLDDGNLAILWENVPGVLSDRGNAFGCLLAGLAGESAPIEPTGGRWTDAGLVVGPRRAAAWRVMDAQYQRLAQRRRRVFVVAGPVDWCCPEQILFEFEGVRRDSPPSREERESIARTVGAGTPSRCGGSDGVDAGIVPALTASGRGVERTGESRGQDPVVACAWPAEIAPALDAHFGYKQGLEDQHVNGGCGLFVPGIAHTFRGEGHDASEDGTGRGVPLVPLSFNMHKSGSDKSSLGIEEDMAACLRAFEKSPAAVSADAVRRLLPVECERLQGFPDDYTLIPWRGGMMADGPRYRMIGNSMAVPCIEWILKRIKAHRAEVVNNP